jgi:hypothetical protein
MKGLKHKNGQNEHFKSPLKNSSMLSFIKTNRLNSRSKRKVKVNLIWTCSKPGSLWYGFSFISDCMDMRRLERLRAGLQAGPDHVLERIK